MKMSSKDWKELDPKIKEMREAGEAPYRIADALGLETAEVRGRLTAMGMLNKLANNTEYPSQSDRSLRPKGVTAAQWSEEWWAQNDQSFRRGMMQALERAKKERQAQGG